MTKRLCLLFLLCCGSLGLLGEEWWGKEWSFGNSHVEYVFAPKVGYTLLEIRNKQTGRTIPMRADVNREGIWKTLLYEKVVGQTLYAAQGALAEREIVKYAGGQKLVLNWKNVRGFKGAAVNVKVVLDLPDHESMAYGSLELETVGETYQVPNGVIFPNLQGIQSLGDSQLVWPHHLGRIFHNPAENLKRQLHIRQPSPWSMQFLAYHGSKIMEPKMAGIVKKAGEDGIGFVRGTASDETGLYVSTLDPDHNYKLAFIHPGENGNRSFSIWIDNYIPQNAYADRTAKSGGEKWKMPYKVQIGTYAGGWKESCEIYRSWALNQEWAAKGPLRTAEDPEHPRCPLMTDNVFWGGLYEWPAKMIPEAAAFKQYFKVPSSVLWYRWNVAKFDMANPEYFPVNPYLRRGFREMAQMGIPVTPYICGNIWSMDNESWDLYHAAEDTVMEEDGTPKIWNIFNHKNAWMQPDSLIWQRRLTDIASYLFGPWGSSGLYLDVLAAASHDSMNKKLGAMGGGNYWARGSREIMDSLKNVADSNVRKETMVVSEGVGEAYLQHLDGFLTLDWTRGGYTERNGMDIFPLFAHLYHDYASTFGGDIVQFHEFKDNSWQIGMSLFSGMQPMIFAPDIAEPASSPQVRPNDEFMREAMQAWHCAAWKFLNGGHGVEMALVPDTSVVGKAPYALISDIYQNNIKLFFGQYIQWRGPAVMASAWRAFDGTEGVVAVNITEQDQKADLRFGDQVRKDSDRYLWRSWPAPAVKIGQMKNLANYQFTLPRGKVAVFEIRDANAPVYRPLLETEDYHCFKVQEKTNQFLSFQTETGHIWGCEDSLLKNQLAAGKNALTLLADKGAESAVRQTKYHFYISMNQGKAVPDKPEEKTHFLAKRTPFLVSGDAEMEVSAYGKAICGTARIAKSASFSGTEECYFFVNDLKNGSVQLYRNSAGLSAGSYRIAAWPAAATPGLLTMNMSVEKLVWSFADRMRLDNSCWSMQEEAREKYETAVFVNNAMIFVFTGARQYTATPDHWALPHHPYKLSMNLVAPEGVSYVTDSIRLMNEEKDVFLDKAGRLAYTFLLEDGRIMEGFYPLQQKTVISYKGRRYTMYGQFNVDVNRPFMLEEHWKTPNMFCVTAGGSFTDKDIKIQNFYHSPLQVTVEADLPKGFSFELVNAGEAKSLQPFAVFYPELKISVARDCAPGFHELEFFVNYTGRRDSAFKVVTPVWVRSREFIAHASVNGGAKLAAGQECRKNVMAVFKGSRGAALNFALNLMNVNAEYSIPWEITAFNGAKAASGELKAAPQSTSFNISFTPAEDGFYRLNAVIPVYNEEIQNCTMGWNLQVKEDVRLFWDCSLVSGFAFASHDKPMTFSFFVPAGAKRFSVRGNGGWSIWASGLRVLSPGGKVLFDKKGLMRDKDNWIQVPAGEDNAVWKIEAFAGEDLGISMQGDVLPYLWFEK